MRIRYDLRPTGFLGWAIAALIAIHKKHGLLTAMRGENNGFGIYADLRQYKKDMQEAFLLGAVEGGFLEDAGELLPEMDIDHSLAQKGAIAYKAVQGGEMAGGAVIVIDAEKKQGHLDFLYVKHGVQSKGIGKFMRFEIERLHPDIRVWETCTPYFEKRNIHFYINVCGFHAVKFFHAYHKDPNEPEDFYEEEDFEMFSFRKEI